ncbi:MAG: hypothetical protein J3R72DRAFT_488714 [Linnemannia gamsii]|nr:MAG: hypothetical protein J3R72DRAFT_488714 [Linnemannia gamsii]
MTHLTDIPVELLQFIGQLINTSADIKNLVLTCHFCHHYFRHLLWKRVTIRTDTPPVILNTLRAHARFVLSLRFEGAVNKEFYSISFPVLVSFQHTFPERDSQSKYVDSYIPDFFKRNSSIQDLVLTTHGVPTGQQFWDAIYASFIKPRRLQIDGPRLGVQVILGGGPAFWRACSRFEEVVYRGKDQADSAGLGDIDFSRLRRLEYTPTEFPLHTPAFWRRICSCHNLTKLHWGGTIPIQQVALAAKHPIWPSLEDLRLGATIGSDQDLAAVIFHHLPPLKHLNLASGAFGPVCFGILRERHFGTLTSLTAPEFGVLSSGMALDLLQHCSHLEVLQTNHICMRDVRSNPQPWACRGLKHLQVTFDSDPYSPEADTILFEQLSRLTSLEEINISRYSLSPFRGPIVEPSPQWRLDSGLALLFTLTRLEAFWLNDADQDLREEDVEWMLNHWKALRKMSGDFSKETRVQRQLTALVRGRGIVV